MPDHDNSRAARLAHLRRAHLAKGDPIPLPLTMAAIFHAPGDATGFNQYGRFSNPTWNAVEDVLTHLEDAPAVAFPSGMAAISAVFLGLLKAGDRILLPQDGYHTTRILADRFLSRFGVEFDVRPTSTVLDGGFKGYRLVFLETPANPGLDICDIAQVSRAAHAARKPPGSSAVRSSRPGKRRFSSASTRGTTSTLLTRRLPSPSSSQGESISMPETSLPRTTTPPRSQPTNREPRRLLLSKVLPRRTSGSLALIGQTCHSARSEHRGP